MHGWGKVTRPDGGGYEGYFKMGDKHGYGKSLMENGDSYSGNYQNNLRHGWGIYIWK